MSVIGYVKNGTKQKLNMMPASYPASRVTHESVSVTADGVETFAALIGRLFSTCEYDKVNPRSVIDYDDGVYVSHFTMSKYGLQRSYFAHIDIETRVQTSTIKLDSVGVFSTATTSGTTDNSSLVPLSGLKLTLYY